MRGRYIGMKVPVSIYREDIETTNIYGEREMLLVTDKETVGVLRLFNRIAESSVRTDAAATKTRADLDTASGRFIFNAKTAVQLGDKIVVDGIEMKVTGMFRRFGLRGREGNVEVESIAW